MNLPQHMCKLYVNKFKKKSDFMGFRNQPYKNVYN